MNKNTADERTNIFHHLHHNGRLLILPNIWDPFGAMLLQKVGYPAVATSSSAVSLSNGYKDGEKMPFSDLLTILKRMVESVQVPVTADVETAYAKSENQLKEHIRQLLDTGIAGINYEDSQHDASSMTKIDEQCKNLEIIRQVSDSTGSRLFINARIDVYIKGKDLSDDEKLQEAIRRGKAYKDAGADGLYPIILTNKDHMEALVRETALPINVTMIPGIPDFKTLQEIGIARVSMASGYFKNAVFAMKQVAENLLKQEGMDETFQEMVSSDYLNQIV